MYDAVTLDQLRAFATVVDEGSFSAAARKLMRVQSAVSSAMAQLESHLGVTLWDRSTRIPRLSPQGEVLLVYARRVLADTDELRRVSASMAQGLEPSASLCVDALFPLSALVALCAAFAREFPSVDLRLDTQVMSAVSARVLEGSATLGVVSQEGLLPALEQHALAPIRMVPVVAKGHPLARVAGPVSERQLVDAVQIVLSERTSEGAPDRAVLSPRTWRVADLHTKHEMLRAGLGWGNLPEHLVREDLARGTLVRIRPRAWGDEQHTLYLFGVHRQGATFGPAHRWLLSQLALFCSQATARRPRAAASARPRRPTR